MNYIYFGTSEFATIILEKLIANAMVPIAVVTQPDRPAGRGKKIQEPPVKMVAEKYKIQLLQPEKVSSFKFQVSSFNPDVCVVAAYGGIIPKGILEIPKHGFLNVHPSMLPKYRGPSPIQSTILNGDTETGVSIILLDEEIDHGPILMNRESRIMKHETTPELEKELAEIGAELLIKTIPGWIAGKITAAPQDHTKATFTKMIAKEDGHIDWKKSAEEIERHVRAMTSWPGSWTVWKQGGKEMRLHLRRVSILKEGPPCLPAGRDLRSDNTTVGKVLEVSNDGLIVVCGEGRLAISSLQPEGKKEMTARAFANGHPGIVGAVLQ